MNDKRSIVQRIIAVMVAVTMVIGLLPVTAMSARANEGAVTPVTSVADERSLDTYKDIFDEEQVGFSTQYSGRIWADKSVSTKGMTFTGALHLPYNEESSDDDSVTVTTDENNQKTATIKKADKAQFQVAFSTMATTSIVKKQQAAPMDLVLVLDFSPQSNSNPGKVDALLSAVNGAIEEALNDEDQNYTGENRVAVVGYSSQAEVLLPLDHYEEAKLTFNDNSPKVDNTNDRMGGTVICTYKTSTGAGEESTTFPIAKSNGSGVNKYTQYGIYKGMQELTEETQTKSEDELSKRQPVMILLSEGEPKIASTNITNPAESLIEPGGWKDFSTNTAYVGEKTSKDSETSEETPGTSDGQENGAVVDEPSTDDEEPVLPDADSTGTVNDDATDDADNAAEAPAQNDDADASGDDTVMQSAVLSARNAEDDVEDSGSGVDILRNYGVSDFDSNNNELSKMDKRHAQTFATLLTAAYVKDKVTETYYNENSYNNAMRFYTVGIHTYSANAPDLGRMVLDPKNELNSTTSTNQFADEFLGYASDLFGSSGQVSIIDAGIENGQAHKTNFTKTALSGTDIQSVDDLRYNDMFFNVTGSGAELNFGDIFDQIFTNIRTEGAQGATHVTGDSSDSGYISYSDPLGKYMEVKSIDTLIHQNIIYTSPESEEVENNDGSKTTTYTFQPVADNSDDLDNPVYEDGDKVENIIIQVTETSDGTQTLTVKVPAALIPLRLTTVDMTTEHNGNDFDTNEAFPMRLVYSVGLNEDLIDDEGKLKAGSDLDEDEEYLKTHYDAANKQVTFYEGQYSAQSVDKGSYGDAKVTYVPAGNNPFYYLTQNTPVYTDLDCTSRLSSEGGIDPNKTYYFKVPYYYSDNGEATQGEEIVSRPGSQLKADYIREIGGNIFLVPGTPRMSSLTQYTTMKGADTATDSYDAEANATGTATIRMYPSYEKYNDEDHSQPGNGHFLLYLGNNGKLTMPVADDFNQPDPDDPSTDPEDPEQPPITDPDDPVEPEDPSEEPEQPLDPDGPDDLNTVDHFYYIVGYPEDYRTGEVTDDESLWPIKPQGNITRAEVATIFYRLLNKDVREANTTNVSPYYDVDSDDWFATTVSTLAHMGILGGYEDGSFRPNAPITRAEFAAIAARFFENTDDVAYEKGRFTDIVGNEWYADIVQAAVDLNLIGGYPDGTMRPQNSISRAEACAIVNRTIERRPHDEHLAATSDMRTWPDNLPGAWYYADMQEATNGHDYVWIDEDDQRIEEWTKVRPDFDWTLR